MANLYYETAGSEPDAPSLTTDQRVDVAVVGGGFTGLSAALHLAERGVKVALLEAHQPGFGASGRNGGQVNPGLKWDPDVIVRDFGQDLGSRLNALGGGAPDLVFDLIRRHGIACEARQNGTLRAATNARQTASLRVSCEQWARRRAPVELLEAAAVGRATGTDRYPAAMFDRRGGDLNPLSYARGLARAAIQAGASVYGNTQVLDISKGGAKWKLRTPRAVVHADQVVIATNGYTDEVWPALRRTIVPVFGAIAATAPLPDATAREVMPTRSVLYEIGAITVYYRVDAGQRLLIGGRGPMREIAAATAIPHIVNYALKLWPALQGIAWTHAWGGRLAMTRDHYPHVHEPADGILACLGYNGRGVALATAMGVQLANRILNRSDPFDMPITNMKTIALWPLAVRAIIARGRISDYLGL
jgi:glycine/D-amino acid oxidase-like deaminating enzyme